MQATITYLLTEQAQRAQMAATGQPVTRKQQLTIDVTTPEDIAAFSVREDGTLYMDLSRISDLAPLHHKLYRAEAEGWRDIPPHLSYFESGADLLDQMRDDLATAKATREAKAEQERLAKIAREEKERWKNDVVSRYHAAIVRAGLGDLDAYRSRRAGSIPFPGIYEQFSAELDAVGLGGAVYEEVNFAACRAEYDQLLALIAEENTRQIAAINARNEAKIAFIGDWVAKHPDAELRQQHADGLLCRDEVISLIAEEAFVAAGVPVEAGYDDTYCRDNDCPCGETTLKCLPRGVYGAWKPIQAALKHLDDPFELGWDVEFVRVRECLQRDENYEPGGETAGPRRYFARLAMPHGPFRFERMIELD